MQSIRLARRCCLALLLANLACRSTQTRPHNPDWHANVDLAFAGRTYDEDSTDESAAMGLGFAARPAGSIFGGELGLGASVGGGVGEVYAGPRMTLGEGPGLRPYVAGGVTLLRVELDRLFDAVGTPADDTTVAGYAHGGVYYEFDSGITLGLDLRGVFGGSVSAGGFSGKADYLQVGLSFGSAF